MALEQGDLQILGDHPKQGVNAKTGARRKPDPVAMRSLRGPLLAERRYIILVIDLNSRQVIRPNPSNT